MPEKPLTVQIKGLKEMEEAFKKSPKTVQRTIDPAIRKSILLLRAKSVPHTPVDRGFLRGSNKTTFTTLRGQLLNTAPYAIFVHDGTRPHFPPLQAVERWANRHGIPPFVVARNIARKGTKGKPFYDLAIRDSNSLIDSIFKRALTDLTNKLAE